MIDGDAVILITVKEYNRIYRDSLFLDCLRAMGVDNWNGYSDAYQEYSNSIVEEDDDGDTA